MILILFILSQSPGRRVLEANIKMNCKRDLACAQTQRSLI